MVEIAPGGKKRGFSLIEVMMAVMIMSLVFVSSMAVIASGFRMLEDARLSTLSAQVLQSEMENLRLKNWTQLSALPASEAFTIDTSLNSASFDKFSCARNINDVRSDLKQVTLIVQWTSMDGRPHVRRYITYMAKEGLNDYFYRKF